MMNRYTVTLQIALDGHNWGDLAYFCSSNHAEARKRHSEWVAKYGADKNYLVTYMVDGDDDGPDTDQDSYEQQVRDDYYADKGV